MTWLSPLLCPWGHTTFCNSSVTSITHHSSFPNLNQKIPLIRLHKYFKLKNAVRFKLKATDHHSHYTKSQLWEGNTEKHSVWLTGSCSIQLIHLIKQIKLLNWANLTKEGFIIAEVGLKSIYVSCSDRLQKRSFPVYNSLCGNFVHCPEFCRKYKLVFIFSQIRSSTRVSHLVNKFSKNYTRHRTVCKWKKTLNYLYFI